jgi:sugar phosphate isomerase/epimerase
MTRKDFLKTAAAVAGAVAVSAHPSTAVAAPAETSQWPGPKRAVSVYSYVDDLNSTYTLEDCIEEIGSLGTDHYPVGVEILTGAIEGYPNPSDAWVQKWHDMCAKNHVLPVELGHWVDSKLYSEFEPWLSTQESYEQLVQDIKLGNKLGFTRGRTKIGVIDVGLDPVPNWREFLKMALPVAEKYNFRMLTEVHEPTLLNAKVIDMYLEFITKEKCSPWFGLNIDFSVFQNMNYQRHVSPGQTTNDLTPKEDGTYSKVPEMIPLLPYVHCCHAKFNNVNEECEDLTIPYPDIMKTLKENKWDGYMMSEYEGRDRPNGGAFAAVRRQHVLLRKLLGEA